MGVPSRRSIRRPWVGAGRRPARRTAAAAAEPRRQRPRHDPRRNAPAYSPELIRQLVDYTHSLTGGGGPDIPHIGHGDLAEGGALFRPRERPLRTAIGVAVLTFYVVLFIAGSSDIGAQKFVVAIPTFTRVLQVLVIVLPVVTGLLTWKICRDLTGADRLEGAKERIRHARAKAVPEEGQPA